MSPLWTCAITVKSPSMVVPVRAARRCARTWAMDAVAEGRVVAGVAVEVEVVGVVEDGGVAVGGLVDHEDALAFVDALAAEFEFGQSDALQSAVGDGQVAQGFLDRVRDPFRIVDLMSMRPGSRVVTSWSSHVLPSGSAKEP